MYTEMWELKIQCIFAKPFSLTKEKEVWKSTGPHLAGLPLNHDKFEKKDILVIA